MLAISNLKRTIYACNLKSKTDHICLQFLSTRTKYAWKSSLDYDFWTNYAKTKCLQAYLVPIKKRLQAYMVRFGFEIAGIFSPL